MCKARAYCDMTGYNCPFRGPDLHPRKASDLLRALSKRPDERESMLIAPNPGQRSSTASPKLQWKRALGFARLQLPRRPSRPERKLLERLRRLGLCRGAVSIERIAGGLSNHNYAVQSDSQSYFVRVCQDRPLLGIDRANEMVCHHAASLRDLAPEIIHHEPGLLITRFKEGQTLDAVGAARPGHAAAAGGPARAPASRGGTF